MRYPDVLDVIPILNMVDNINKTFIEERIINLERKVDELSNQLSIVRDRNNICIDDSMKFMFKPIK